MFDPDEKAPEEPTPGVETEREYGRLGQDLGERYELDATASEVSTELEVLFWSAVVFANVALLGLSTGAMVLWFLDRARLGGGLLLAGLLGLALTYRQYRRYADGDYDAAADGSDDAVDAGDPEDREGNEDGEDGRDGRGSESRNDVPEDDEGGLDERSRARND